MSDPIEMFPRDLRPGDLLLDGNLTVRMVGKAQYNNTYPVFVETQDGRKQRRDLRVIDKVWIIRRETN